MKSKHECKLLRDSISHLPKLLPSASWFERLKRSINKWLLVSINHPEVFSYLKSSTAIEKESKRQVEAGHIIIHPLSDFKKYWNILIFVFILSHLLMTAFTIGFYTDMTNYQNAVMTLVDVICCFILWIEICIHFRTGYIISETNEIVINPKAIAKNYFFTYFIFDAICSLPYALFMMWVIREEFATINGGTIIYMFFLFSISIYRFNRILCYYTSIPIMLKLSENTSNVVVICIRTFYLWHWASCIRRLIPLYVEKNPIYSLNWHEAEIESKFHVSRVHLIHDRDFSNVENVILDNLYEILSNYTLLNKYTRTMMITLKLGLQSGYGSETADSVLNMLMTSFIILAGWVYCSYVLIVVSNIIMASSISTTKFQDLISEIKVYADNKKLSRELRMKMIMFVEKKFQKNYFNEEAIKQSTAVCLRKEIQINACSNLVARVPLFKEIPDLLLEDIIGCLQFEIYFPQDIIIQAETTGDSMYFIAYGTAAILSTRGRRLQILSDGSHFGEISLLIRGQKRTATVQALELCEVYKLSYKDFRKVIEPHKNILKRLEDIARERIRNTYIQENSDRTRIPRFAN
ncbi:hypothetical protein PVAND_013660 [Polypedilum vanderplanki]|uniref:Cyclic nucleotide-binding domain-containing protein n=1 Tax=Polypedilum vanderplanki TaxID=319348 RepID=A0A9J6CQ27_POLVA|nr:hypothetical protein PVAND_013660 [Polypedilum vanderplanki]